MTSAGWQWCGVGIAWGHTRSPCTSVTRASRANLVLRQEVTSKIRNWIVPNLCCVVMLKKKKPVLCGGHVNTRRIKLWRVLTLPRFHRYDPYNTMWTDWSDGLDTVVPFVQSCPSPVQAVVVAAVPPSTGNKLVHRPGRRTRAPSRPLFERARRIGAPTRTATRPRARVHGAAATRKSHGRCGSGRGGGRGRDARAYVSLDPWRGAVDRSIGGGARSGTGKATEPPR